MTWRMYSIIVLLPLVAMTVVATLRPLQWISLVPDPMATHFDAEGNPDGFSSPITSIALITGINLVVVIAVVLGLRLKFLTGLQGRFLSGSAAFTVVLISVLQIELFKSQSSLTVATEASFPLSVMGMTLGFAAIAGIISIGLVPTPSPSATHQATPEHSSAQSTPEDLTWRSVEMMHPGVQFVVLLAIAGVLGFLTLAPGWISLVIAVVTVILVIATWGWRISGAGTGLITRAGSGLRITRTNGQVLEISTQDAVTAANLLNYYGQRETAQ